MNLVRPLSGVTKKLYYTGNLVHQFAELVNNRNQTYFPELRQKSKWTIFRDQLLWIFKNREINRYYYVYGLDRRDETKGTEIIGYRKFRRMRDQANLRPQGLNFNYACLLRDKFVFGQFLNSLNIPTPKNIALIESKGITWLDNMQRAELISLSTRQTRPIDGFCKKLMGLKGEGAFPLRIENGMVFSGSQLLSHEDLVKKLQGTHLLQERMTQHKEMSRLHEHSINTMRILTFNNNGKIQLFCAALRVGTNGRNVDNWGAGGIAIGIDSEEGTLRKNGMYKPRYGGKVQVHPNSGIHFEGFAIPYFKESVELVCSVHRYLYGIHSIGWDVAVTENGPVIIEANEDWDGSFTMSTEDNFKSRFLNMFNN